MPDGSIVAVQLVIEPSQFQASSEVAFHGFESFGVVVKLKSLLNTDDYTTIGYIGDGSVILDAASATAGDPVSGSFSGTFIQNPLAQ